ncbi:unnamed protein product [Closterium sp. NIES-54]
MLLLSPRCPPSPFPPPPVCTEAIEALVREDLVAAPVYSTAPNAAAVCVFLSFSLRRRQPGSSSRVLFPPRPPTCSPSLLWYAYNNSPFTRVEDGLVAAPVYSPPLLPQSLPSFFLLKRQPGSSSRLLHRTPCCCGMVTPSPSPCLNDNVVAAPMHSFPRLSAPPALPSCCGMHPPLFIPPLPLPPLSMPAFLVLPRCLPSPSPFSSSPAASPPRPPFPPPLMHRHTSPAPTRAAFMQPMPWLLPSFGGFSFLPSRSHTFIPSPLLVPVPSSTRIPGSSILSLPDDSVPLPPLLSSLLPVSPCPSPLPCSHPIRGSAPLLAPFSLHLTTFLPSPSSPPAFPSFPPISTCAFPLFPFHQALGSLARTILSLPDDSDALSLTAAANKAYIGTVTMVDLLLHVAGGEEEEGEGDWEWEGEEEQEGDKETGRERGRREGGMCELETPVGQLVRASEEGLSLLLTDLNAP